jgi:hypothetical protein
MKTPSLQLDGADLWWGDGTPRLPGDPRPCGLIGNFHPREAADAARILDEAESALRRAGCAVAIGPMDGSTWRNYRLVTSGTENRAPFLLEPTNPPEWPSYFATAGWRPLARYVSSVAPLDDASAATRARSRLEALGVRIRALRGDDYTGELRRIFPTCLRSFASNFLYTPITEDAFVSLYGKAESLVDPDLVLIAAQGETIAGFVFCLPDGPTLLVKTLARLPDRAFAGLGAVLLEQVHAAARAKGMTEAIHALKHEDNPSCQTSARHGGRVFREYTLFHKPLAPPA